MWWPLVVLGVAGVFVGLAVTRLPGEGGHIPAMGLASGKPTTLPELPGVLVAGLRVDGSPRVTARARAQA